MPDPCPPPAFDPDEPPADTPPADEPSTAARPRLPLFARADFRAVAGDILRPGGLALTRRGLALALLPANSLVADLGCGPGATARLLAEHGHRVLALDLNPDDLRQARTSNVTALRARAQRLPLPDACLDAVFCECVLSASGDHDAVLAEAARCLKPGGRLVLSDLCLRGGPGRRPNDAGGSTTRAGQGGCLSGALPLDGLLTSFSRVGLCVQTFEDHSRLLAELAARLVLSGLPARELADSLAGGLAGGQADCRVDRRAGGQAEGCRPGARPGYFLCLAIKAGLRPPAASAGPSPEAPGTAASGT